jgi:predicted nucleic acid-binding protein
VKLAHAWAGPTIGANDLVISAQAVTLGYTLATENEQFTRIAELAIENWPC